MTPPATTRSAPRPVTGPVALEIPARRPRFDLSRRSVLVSRFWARGPGLLLRRLVGTLGGPLSRFGPSLFGVAATLRLAALSARPGLATPLDAVLVLAAGGVLAATVVRRLRRGMRLLRRDGGALDFTAEIEPGLTGLAAIWGVVALTGGAGSPARALFFVLVALILPWHGARAGILTVAAVLASLLLEGLWSGALVARPATLALEGGFVVVFALLYDLSLSTLVRRARDAARAGLDHYLDDLEQRAREFRLIVSGDAPGEVEDGRERWLVASVSEVEAAVRGVLEVAETALSTHTVAVYLLSPDGRQLRLRECLTRAARIRRAPILAGEGLPGVVLRRVAPLRLHGEFRGAVYDQSRAQPKAFLGVPLLARLPGREQPLVRGVLLADRLEDRPFGERDERLLESLARQIIRAIEGERVLGTMRREKDEKARFFKAIETLNLLSKPQEICEQVARLAQEVAPVDFVAVTLVRGEGEALRHRIVEVVGPGADPLRGQSFEDNKGLVSNVVRLGASLPSRDFHVMSRTVVFEDGLPMPELRSLKVIPMSVGEDVVGTLCCGAREAEVLGEEPLRMLGVLAMQAAGSIARARLFERTEELATTDGLTGLTNHRRFQELFDMHLAAARRYGRSVAMVLTDVDHFKSVNDTYGHPMGDEVLRGVAAVLRQEARDTDVCARYGGEEFAVILPETDAEGARVIAERIRKTLEARTFQTELGPLKVTLSAGVAAFPAHGEEKQAVIDRCDRALYAAKRGGRNRVVTADHVL